VPSGQRVYLRRVSNSFKGSDSHVDLKVDPSYAQEIERLCHALHGLAIAAVDVIIGDTSVPARPDNYKILEINAAPGMVYFRFPWQGEPVDLAPTILDYLEHGAEWPQAAAGA
jgi:D-alanine-D-alanine ligase-like ATP-grasp enzyme